MVSCARHSAKNAAPNNRHIGGSSCAYRNDPMPNTEVGESYETVRETYKRRFAPGRRPLHSIGAKLLVQWRLRSQTEGLLRNALWWWSSIWQRRRRPVRVRSRLQLRKTSAGASTCALRLATGVERVSLDSLLHLNPAGQEEKICGLLFAHSRPPRSFVRRHTNYLKPRRSHRQTHSKQAAITFLQPIRAAIGLSCRSGAIMGGGRKANTVGFPLALRVGDIGVSQRAIIA